MKTKHLISIFMMALFVLAGTVSFAQGRSGHHSRGQQQKQEQPGKDKNFLGQMHRNSVVYKSRPQEKTMRSFSGRQEPIHFHERPYYHKGGNFYAMRNGLYVRVVPPIGITVTSIPRSFIRITVGPSVYFYAEGTFYLPSGPGGQYVVAAPPVGAIVSRLPQGAVAIEINGEPYFEFNDIIYKAVFVGKPAYEVVGTLID